MREGSILLFTSLIKNKKRIYLLQKHSMLLFVHKSKNKRLLTSNLLNMKLFAKEKNSHQKIT